jgi:hypothetical protein
MPKVARYQGSTVFCEMIKDILVRAELWGGQAGKLHGAQTYKQHYDIIGIIRSMALEKEKGAQGLVGNPEEITWKT